MDPIYEEQQSSWTSFNPITFVFQFLELYGWYILGAAVATIYLVNKLRPKYNAWKQAREDAEYHKDPDVVLARMEAIQRAREKQQELLIEASERAVQQQKEREERKRAEAVERMRKYGAEESGHRLGTASDGDYLPLSGGGSTSSYRAPKRSACSRGGCGR